MRNATPTGRFAARTTTAAIILGVALTSATPATGAPSDVAPSPAPTRSGKPSLNPCAVVSKNDVASAAGATTDQVYAPTQPTKNECIWAVAGHGGVPAQRVAFTIQSVDQVKSAHGMARFGAILNVAGSIPGVSLPSNPIVTRAFADAQVVAGLGDRAGWKNGTLSVLKNETLYAVTSTGQPSDADSLRVSRAVAQSALNHVDVSGAATPKPSP